MGFNKRHATIALGGIVLLLAIAQFASLLDARLEAGDTFAEYSTLRADPMGMMALYNALDALPQYDTLQYVRPFDELPDGADTTLVIAGASLGMDPLPILESLEQFIATGGRVVVAFYPLKKDFAVKRLRSSMRARDRAREKKKPTPAVDQKDLGASDEEAADIEKGGDTPNNTAESPRDSEGDTAPVATSEETKEETDGTGKEEGEQDDDGEEEDGDDEPYPLSSAELKAEDISERLGFEYGFKKPSNSTTATRSDSGPPVEEDLRMRSGLYFTDLDNSWTPVFVRPGGNEEASPHAVIMERPFGNGTIVLCSDTYFLSNEALRKDRMPQLIQWLMGSNHTLLFSEVHLGNGQQDRIMTLVRRYRLHGVLAGLLLVGILFIWKNATTLIPRRERMTATQAARECSQQRGLDSLLTRFVPATALLETCVREWHQHAGQTTDTQILERIEQAARKSNGTTKNKNEIVAMYNDIAREVHKRAP